MTSVADVMSLPRIAELSGREAGEALMAFMRRFNPDLAAEAEDSILYDDDLMSAITADVLIEGLEDREYRHFVCRLGYRGLPFALIRFDGSRGEESERRWTVRMTDAGVAEALNADVLGRLRMEDDRLRESPPEESAGNLLSFGAAADLDIGAQTLIFRKTLRLASISQQAVVAVLEAVEDGPFVLTARRNGGFASETFDSIDDANAAFLAQVNAMAANADPEARHFGNFMHGKDCWATTAIIPDRPAGLKCVVESRRDDFTVDPATDPQVEFMRIAGEILDRQSVQYRPAPAPRR